MPAPASCARRDSSLGTAFVLVVGFLLFVGVVFALGFGAGRWTYPKQMGTLPSDEEARSEQVRETTRFIHDNEYNNMMEVLQQQREQATPEEAAVLDRLAQEFYKYHLRRNKHLELSEHYLTKDNH